MASEVTKPKVRSVLDLIDREHGLDAVVRRSETMMRAAKMLDTQLALAASKVVDGIYIEVPVMALLNTCELRGVGPRDLQFVLNLLRKDAYSFGCRRGAEAFQEKETVQMMRRVAMGTASEQEQQAVPVHRFVAAQVLQS